MQMQVFESQFLKLGKQYNFIGLHTFSQMSTYANNYCDQNNLNIP